MTNFYNELKYGLNILMNFKDIVDFIYQLLKLRSVTDIDKDIRLYLHTYFNCEMTIVLSIPNPYNLDDSTRIYGQTSSSQHVDMILGEVGVNMQKVIREKRICSHQVDETSSMADFSHAIYNHLNIAIDNYAAYPIVIDDVCQYVIVLCNRKPTEDSWQSEVNQRELTFDEHKLAHFVAYSFQSVVHQIKAIESVTTGESKFRQLSKLQRMMMRSSSVERALEIACKNGMEDLYLLWIKEC